MITESLPARRSIRLPYYNYADGGYYFITICTQYRLPLFGEIQEGKMILNDAGKMVTETYYELAHKFKTIECDEFICMPNHVHFIIINTGPIASPGAHAGAPLQQIIRWFKTMTTNYYMQGVKKYGWPSFGKKLWQRNYYEHIIRNENSYFKLKEYIMHNPLQWHDDDYYFP